MGTGKVGKREWRQVVVARNVSGLSHRLPYLTPLLVKTCGMSLVALRSIFSQLTLLLGSTVKANILQGLCLRQVNTAYDAPSLQCSRFTLSSIFLWSPS